MTTVTSPTRLAVVGPGRLGTAIARRLRGGSPAAPSCFEVSGPLGRGQPVPPDAGAALLCVPDGAIAAAAAALAPGVPVGHCSGALGLGVLGDREGFSLHPLMTVNGSDADPFSGAACAIAGSTPSARELAADLADALGLAPFHVDDADRPAYHAAASIASNFLLALEDAAEQLAATAGLGREALVPLVRATVEAWARIGSERALTGPVARGDHDTVARQRAAVAERAPDLLAVFDELVAVTERLASRRTEVPA